MKVIFLDIDGVLNTRASMTASQEHDLPGYGADGWCPKTVVALKKILAATDAKIVISSTWRFQLRPKKTHRPLIASFDWDGESPRCELHRAFKMHDLPIWLDVTPDHQELRGRGGEIQEWLDAHPDVESYVILDDDSDMLEKQLPCFVQTSFHGEGLTEELADRAVAILNGDRKK